MIKYMRACRQGGLKKTAVNPGLGPTVGSFLVWTYRNPVRIHFGVDSFNTVAGLIGGRNYLLVTYDEPIFTTLGKHLAKSAGPATLVINNITPNPDFLGLDNSCLQMAAARPMPEVIVALGGGSVLDAAKVLAVGAEGFGAIQRHLESAGTSTTLPATALPLIAVPTTAGTGSEVTSWATVWDTVRAKKYSLARDDLYPTDAVVDPRLMAGMPRGLTVSTGLDALSHALESIWNVNANPVSTNHAISAARLVLAHLVPLAADLSNLELRGHLAKAATMAGMAFSNTKTALAHSLSYPITLHHGVPHGLACSFSLPAVMRSVIGANEVCDAALRGIFGDDLAAGADRLAAFLGELGVSTDPGTYGVSDGEWAKLVTDAIDGERGRNFIAPREQVEDVFF